MFLCGLTFRIYEVAGAIFLTSFMRSASKVKVGLRFGLSPFRTRLFRIRVVTICRRFFDLEVLGFS